MGFRQQFVRSDGASRAFDTLRNMRNNMHNMRNNMHNMRKSSVLTALFPHVRQGVLAATLAQPEKWWYLSELATCWQIGRPETQNVQERAGQYARPDRSRPS
jgi:hypothetical protein